MNSSFPSKFLDREPILEQRLGSLDAYRGLIMIALAFNGFGLAATAKKVLEKSPDSDLWKNIQYQFSHVEWVGCAFWDMIQPSFMFMVGVSMAYSYVKRYERGDSWIRMFGHALSRAIILCLLGIFLISNGSKTTEWSLMNVLTQIGLGYPLLFLMWRRPWPVQLFAVVVILASTWAGYHFYPAEGIDIAVGNPDLGISAEWAQQYLEGVPIAWQKGVNLGNAIDLKVMNWFPLAEEFKFNRGGYQSINFFPSLATMIIGLMCGELLRSTVSDGRKWMALILIGILGIAAGWFWHTQGCPIIKRIWTPSWALFSAGICCLILAFFFGVIDGIGFRAWSFPLIVVGMNSIAIYVMGMLLRPWTARTLQTHFGQRIFGFIKDPETGAMIESWYSPTLQATLVGFCFWLACYWMYRNRIFIRI